LAALSLIPVIHKRLRAKKTGDRGIKS